MVALFIRGVGPGAYGRLFCSVFQFGQWCKMTSKSAEKEDSDSDDDEGSET